MSDTDLYSADPPSKSHPHETVTVTVKVTATCGRCGRRSDTFATNAEALADIAGCCS